MTRYMVLDLETTGLNPESDRIVEFASVILTSDLQIDSSWSWRCNPETLIPKEASDVHGILDEHVVGLQPFSFYAERVQLLVDIHVLVAYNHAFDVPFLHYELERCGLSGIPKDARVIDPLLIFRKQVPHTLIGAANYYLHKQHLNAHSALDDALTTAHILQTQRHQFPDTESMIHKDETTYLDRAKRLMLNPAGQVCFAFGKHKGKALLSEVGYAEWMLQAGFSNDTKREIRRILDAL